MIVNTCFGVLVFFSVVNTLNFYVVTTKNGLVRGTEEKTVDKQQLYYTFRSIPYAQPPMGDLRFEPPLPIQNWNGILNATKERSVCVQTQSTSVRTDRIIGSEDCLYLTVYTPKLSNFKNSNKFPVMFWIHGGGFFQGDNSYQLYAPDYFIEEYIVVVTITYRLGILGFISTEDLVCPGNNGLRDQILALKWVNDNIEFFGGDNSKITIWGESAGGIAVSHLLCSPKSAGLFHAAITESGSSLMVLTLGRNQREIAFRTGQILGIKTNNSAELKAALQSVDYETLFINAYYAGVVVTSQTPFDTYPFTPVIEHPHKKAIITESPYKCLEKGLIHRKPVLMGYNSREGDGLPDTLLRLALTQLKFSPILMSPPSLNIQDPEIAYKVGNLVKKYFFKNDTDTYTEDHFIHWLSFYHMTKAIVKQAEFSSVTNDVYLYKFTYVSLLGNPLRLSWDGVGHAEDLNYLFHRVTSPLFLSEEDVTVRKRMVRMWANFAKYFNPTPNDDLLLQNVKWPKCTPFPNMAYLNIGEHLTVSKNPEQADMIFWSTLAKTYGNKPFVVY